tara:strand:+ start:93 stop:1754 length:1662 start_codon:yes stop_codon:yes gene_type:complete
MGDVSMIPENLQHLVGEVGRPAAYAPNVPLVGGEPLYQVNPYGELAPMGYGDWAREAHRASADTEWDEPYSPLSGTPMGTRSASPVDAQPVVPTTGVPVDDLAGHAALGGWHRPEDAHAPPPPRRWDLASQRFRDKFGGFKNDFERRLAAMLDPKGGVPYKGRVPPFYQTQKPLVPPEDEEYQDLPQYQPSSGAKLLPMGIDNPTFDLIPGGGGGGGGAPAYQDVYGGPSIDIGLIIDPAVQPLMSFVKNTSRDADEAANSRKLIGPCGGKWMPTRSELVAQGKDVVELAKEIPGYRMFAQERDAQYHRLHTVTDSLDSTLAMQESRSGALGDADWSQNPITRTEIGEIAGRVDTNRDILSQLEGVKLGILRDSRMSTSAIGRVKAARLQKLIIDDRTNQWNTRTDAALNAASLEQLVDIATGGVFDISPEQVQGMSVREKEGLEAGLRVTIKKAYIERQKMEQQAAGGGNIMLPPRIAAALQRLQGRAPPDEGKQVGGVEAWKEPPIRLPPDERHPARKQTPKEAWGAMQEGQRRRAERRDPNLADQIGEPP